MDEALKNINKVELTMENLKSLIGDAVEAGRKAGKKDTWFGKTEQLLYSLPDLKLKVAQDEEDIKQLEKYEFPHQAKPGKSKDVVMMPTGFKRDDYTELEERIESRKASMERTKQEILRIERAIETIKDDPYYDIIPMKYFDGLSIEDMAERFGKDESTVKRNKNRLIRKLKVILFGSDALEI